MGLFATSVSPVARIGGALGLAGTTTSLSAQTFGNYKAIVILDMDGGNDAMNMFPPTMQESHEIYKEIRTNLGVELYKKDDNGEYTTDKIDLYDDEHYNVDETTEHFIGSLGKNQPYFVPLDPKYPDKLDTEYGKEDMYTKGSYHTKKTDGTYTGLGIHALMPEMASLYNKGVLSIASNTGVLIEPVKKEEIEDGSVRLPEFLFSHGNQRELVSTLQAGKLGSKSGWAGRLADSWQVNGSLGLNISYGGSTKTFMGLTTSGLTMGTNGPTSYGNRLNIEKFDELLIGTADRAQNTNIFDMFTNNINKKTAMLSKDLSSIWASAPIFTTPYKLEDKTLKPETYPDVNNSYGDPLFTLYTGNGITRENLGTRTHHGLDTRIFKQLESTAKMIKISQDFKDSDENQVERQIFYVRQAGHDVHGKQVDTHSKHLRAISLAVSDFYKALEAMGLEEKVLLVSMSDFGRTIKSNSDGTDHGWGGHSFMMCGDAKFNGGKVYGDVLEDLSLEGVNAYTKRARIIPTTSIEQTLAPALKWFGVDDATMAETLPNLENFRTDVNSAESAFLEGVFA